MRAVTDKYLARLEAAAEPASAPDAGVTGDVEAIRAGVRDAHGTNIRFVIWAGAPGSLEDKVAMYATGLLKGGPMFYALDSSDPRKLKSIVDDMQQRAREPLGKLLPATVAVCSPGGEFNAERLLFLFDKIKIEAAPNFLIMSAPGSELEALAGTRGFRILPPMRQAAEELFLLALAGRDVKQWVEGATLNEADRTDALKLAAFLRAQAEAGRDKVTLFLPRSWMAVGPWTRTLFEGATGIRIVIGEKFNGRTYRKPSAPNQDRVFLPVQRRGEAHPEAVGITAVRGAGYPIAFMTFAAKGPLSRYLEFMRLVSSSAASFEKRRAASQTAELYNTLVPEALANPRSANTFLESAKWWRGMVGLETPESLAGTLRDGASRGKFSFGEMAFFGDLRYSEEGKLMRRALETGAQRIFRVKLRMPVDIQEGPGAMGHAESFTLLILAREQARFPTAGYEPDRNVAQFMAAKLALERGRRIVRAILVKDLSNESIAALEEFFTEAAALLEIQ